MPQAITPEWIEERSEPELNTGCRLWSLSRFRSGYGKSNGRAAHRLSWAASNGPIPAGAHVLHRCDTPACVNPDHLFVGSHSDNMKDMRRKGRGPSNAPLLDAKAKLKPADVRRIRDLVADGRAVGVVAKSYRVDWTTVWRIARGKTWGYV